MTSAPNTQPISERKVYYHHRINDFALPSLWESLHTRVPPTPTSAIDPALWQNDTIRPLLAETGELISAIRTQRRVLTLPGETAPAHRQAALRLVLNDTPLEHHTNAYFEACEVK